MQCSYPNSSQLNRKARLLSLTFLCLSNFKLRFFGFVELVHIRLMHSNISELRLLCKFLFLSFRIRRFFSLSLTFLNLEFHGFHIFFFIIFCSFLIFLFRYPIWKILNWNSIFIDHRSRFLILQKNSFF
jgi:hypothetical protein